MSSLFSMGLSREEVLCRVRDSLAGHFLTCWHTLMVHCTFLARAIGNWPYMRGIQISYADQCSFSHTSKLQTYLSSNISWLYPMFSFRNKHSCSAENAAFKCSHCTILFCDVPKCTCNFWVKHKHKFEKVLS